MLSKDYVPKAGDSIEYEAGPTHADLVKSKYKEGFSLPMAVVRRVEGVVYVYEFTLESDQEKGYPWYTVTEVVRVPRDA